MPSEAELPDNMPVSIARLPRNKANYPVPWFVWYDPASGEPDFRILKPQAIETAFVQHLCWICGDPLVGTQAFVVGPMCIINRVSAEPPSHLLCARWAAVACPFLARPNMTRREIDGVDTSLVPGIMIERNPGVTAVWLTRQGRWQPFRASNGVLIDIGEPLSVEWFAQGRAATRDEIMHSIDTGYPLLMEMAEQDGPEAVADLERLRDMAMPLVPA